MIPLSSRQLIENIKTVAAVTGDINQQRMHEPMINKEYISIENRIIFKNRTIIFERIIKDDLDSKHFNIRNIGKLRGIEVWEHETGNFCVDVYESDEEYFSEVFETYDAAKAFALDFSSHFIGAENNRLE